MRNFEKSVKIFDFYGFLRFCVAKSPKNLRGNANFCKICKNRRFLQIFAILRSKIAEKFAYNANFFCREVGTTSRQNVQNRETRFWAFLRYPSHFAAENRRFSADFCEKDDRVRDRFFAKMQQNVKGNANRRTFWFKKCVDSAENLRFSAVVKKFA